MRLRRGIQHLFGPQVDCGMECLLIPVTHQSRWWGRHGGVKERMTERASWSADGSGGKGLCLALRTSLGPHGL